MNSFILSKAQYDSVKLKLRNCTQTSDDVIVEEAILALEILKGAHQSQEDPDRLAELLEQRDMLHKAARALCVELCWEGAEPEGDAWDNLQTELAKTGGQS